MEKTETTHLQHQVDELSRRIQLLEQQMSRILATQSESQSHLELLKKQSELRMKEQQMQAKRARLSLPRLP